MQVSNNDISMNLVLNTTEMVVQVKKSNELLKELRNSLQTTADGTKKVESHLGGLSTGFRHFMQMAATARFALLDFHDVFLRLPMSIIKTSGEIERMTKLMEGLSTATDKVADAKKGRDFVFSMAQNAPFEVKALTDSFVKLKSGGIDPMNGSMQSLVDSVAKFGGSSDQLHRASVAIQQMSGKGVISMEELRQQLGEAVPDAINMMAIGVGKSMSELVKSISNGEVESKSALARMFAVMSIQNYGAAADMMNTWTGMMERLKTKWELFKFEVGGGNGDKGAFYDAKEELKSLLDMFDGGSARAFGADMSEVMYEMVHAFKLVTESVVKYYEEIKVAGELMLYYFAGSKVLAGVNALQAAYASMMAAHAKASAVYIATQTREAEVAAATAATKLIAVESEIHANKTKLAMYLLGNAASAAQVVALRAEIVAQEINVVALRAQTTAQLALNGAKVAGAGVSGLLATAMTALGGPIGLITIAIMAGVTAWMMWGDKAEEAAERGRRAISGMSKQKDLLDEDKNIAKHNSDAEQYDKDGYTKMAEASRKLAAKGEENRKLIQKSIDDGAARDLVSRSNALAEVEIAAQTKGEKEVRDAYNKRHADQKEKISNDTSLTDTQRKAATKANDKTLEGDIKTVGKTIFTKEREIREKKIAELKASLAETKKSDSEVSAVKLAIQKQEELIAVAETKGKATNLIGTPTPTIKDPKKDKGGSGTPKDQVGTLNKQLTDAETDLELYTTNKAKMLDDLTKAEEIGKATRLKYEEMLANGALTETVKGGGKKGQDTTRQLTNSDADKAKVDALIKQATEAEIAKASVAALKTETDALNKEQTAFTESQSASGLGVEFVNQKMADLTAQYEANRVKLEGVISVEQTAAHNRRLMIAADAAALGYKRDVAKETAELEIDLTDNAQDKIRKQYELTTLKLGAEYAERVADFTKSADWEILSEEAKNERLLAVAADYEQKKANAAKKFQKDSETPLDKLGKQWADVTTNMNQATASWANGFMDQLTSLITTGKADWRKFTISMLTDIARINLQKSVGGAITGLMGTIGDAAKGAVGAGKTGASPFAPLMDGVKKLVASFGGAESAANDLTQSTTDTVAASLKEMFGIGTKMTAEQSATIAINQLAIAALNAAQALGSSGSASSGSSGIGGLAGMIGGLFGGSSGNVGGGMLDMGTAGVSEVGAAIPVADIATTVLSANGNVMTEFGPLALQKYANGGVAKSPQLSIFGEGSMAEAYVPLPDGRSIPVTMTGGEAGGGGSVSQQVNISIIVNQGEKGEKQSEAGDESGAWNKVTQQIKTIVVQELTTQQRPGGLLYK